MSWLKSPMIKHGSCPSSAAAIKAAATKESQCWAATKLPPNGINREQVNRGMGPIYGEPGNPGLELGRSLSWVLPSGHLPSEGRD